MKYIESRFNTQTMTKEQALGAIRELRTTMHLVPGMDEKVSKYAFDLEDAYPDIARSSHLWHWLAGSTPPDSNSETALSEEDQESLKSLERRLIVIVEELLKEMAATPSARRINESVDDRIDDLEEHVSSFLEYMQNPAANAMMIRARSQFYQKLQRNYPHVDLHEIKLLEKMIGGSEVPQGEASQEDVAQIHQEMSAFLKMSLDFLSEKFPSA